MALDEKLDSNGWSFWNKNCGLLKQTSLFIWDQYFLLEQMKSRNYAQYNKNANGTSWFKQIGSTYTSAAI